MSISRKSHSFSGYPVFYMNLKCTASECLTDIEIQMAIIIMCERSGVRLVWLITRLQLQLRHGESPQVSILLLHPHYTTMDFTLSHQYPSDGLQQYRPPPPLIPMEIVSINPKIDSPLLKNIRNMASHTQLKTPCSLQTEFRVSQLDSMWTSASVFYICKI